MRGMILLKRILTRRMMPVSWQVFLLVNLVCHSLPQEVTASPRYLKDLYYTEGITSCSPAQNRLHVAKDTVISVTFSSDMNPSTIHSGTFRVYASQSGIHAGTYNYDSGTRTVTFDPDTDFSIGEMVTVVLTTGISYAAGGSLPAPFEWCFHIEAITGTGAFILPKIEYPTGNSPYAVLSADLDKDLDVDLVVANYSSGNISVLLNTGNGAFSPKTDFAVTSPYALFPADLDADGDVDLAGANYSNRRVFVMLNNGNGSFQAPVYYYIGDYPYSVHAADLDADGDIDLVAANNYNISVLFNNGSGTFQNITNYTAGTTPYSVYAADLDADGDMDLVTANRSSNNVSVLRNNGNGTFQPKPITRGLIPIPFMLPTWMPMATWTWPQSITIPATFLCCETTATALS